MSGTVRPTKKQQQLLVYIEQFISEHGYSPSYREIMNGCQYNSVATVALHVGSLIKRGHLRKRDHSARSIEVIKDNRDPGSLDETTGTKSKPDSGGQWLVGQAERLVNEVERSPDLTAAMANNIATVLQTCTILGFEGQITTLYARYESLKQKAV